MKDCDGALQVKGFCLITLEWALAFFSQNKAFECE